MKKINFPNLKIFSREINGKNDFFWNLKKWIWGTGTRVKLSIFLIWSLRKMGKKWKNIRNFPSKNKKKGGLELMSKTSLWLGIYKPRNAH